MAQKRTDGMLQGMPSTYTEWANRRLDDLLDEGVDAHQPTLTAHLYAHFPAPYFGQTIRAALTKVVQSRLAATRRGVPQEDGTQTYLKPEQMQIEQIVAHMKAQVARIGHLTAAVVRAAEEYVAAHPDEDVSVESLLVMAGLAS